LTNQSFRHFSSANHQFLCPIKSKTPSLSEKWGLVLHSI
jgi:hypothetical protein